MAKFQSAKEINMTKKIQNGPYQEYYKNGKLKLKCTYKNGMLNGSYQEYNENGCLERKCTYKNDKLNGLYEGYYENGQLAKKTNYKNDQENGPCELYDINGECFAKFNYKNGLLDGPWKYDFVFGNCTVKFYKDGKEVSKAEYDFLTRIEKAQLAKDKSDKKATSKTISDKSDKNDVNHSNPSRADMRSKMIELQKRAHYYSTTLSKITPKRHELAVALNNLRHEFGCNAKKIASHSKKINMLREKAINQR